MLTTEFKMEDAIAVWREESREEGREELKNSVLELLDSGCSLEDLKAFLCEDKKKQ